MKNFSLFSSVAQLFAVALCASAAFAADSTGSDYTVKDLGTNKSAVYKLVDNGDGTKSLQYIFVSGGGATSQGVDFNIKDLATGKALIEQLVDNGDGTKAVVVSCPDCAGGGGGGTISDTAYSSTTWNGVTTDGASKNALRDYFVGFDSNGNAKVDVLDQAAGIPLTNGSGVLQSPITDNSSNWNTAFTDRLKWDGGSTGLTAATGRISLGLVIGTNVEAWDADLDTWATLTPGANFQTMVPHTFSQMRSDLGLVIGTNVEAWSANLDSWSAIATSSKEAVSSEQTVGDANATWTAGKTTMRATAGMSASRVITLPLAAGYPAGKPILFVDKVTGAGSAFIRTFAAAGSDTVEGGLSYSPYPGPGTFEFETDGVSAWIAIHDKGSITEFRDPTDPTKVGQVSASNIGTGHTSVAAWPDINGTWTPAQLLVPTAVKTSGYTAAVDDLVPVDTTSGNVTITLPTAPANGSQIGIKQVIRGGTNTVTYACGGSDVLNKTGGATSGTLTLSSAAVVLQYKASGAIWYIIADDMPYGSLLANTNTWSVGQTFSGHNTEEGVTATGATGTGKQVYDNAPTLTGHPTIEGVTSTGASGSGKSLYQTSPTINGATQDRLKGTAGSYTVTMNGANTASTKTAAGSDISGLITLTMSSTGNISASICTISGFNFASTPGIILVPNSATAWTAQGNTKVCNVSNITTTSFDISGGTAGLVSGTTYTFYWVAVQ